MKRTNAEIYCTVNGKPGRRCLICKEAKVNADFRFMPNGISRPECRLCENAKMRAFGQKFAAEHGHWPSTLRKRRAKARASDGCSLAVALGYLR